MRIAVVGHVEHVTIAAAPALPRAGDILHFDDLVSIAGGGGGIAFFQLAKGDADLHLFTAIGLDDAALHVYDAVVRTGATIHAALRQASHTRDLVVITPDGERTIFVVGEPLQPRRDDRLSWDILETCDAAYFTGTDPETLVEARRARLLVITARRSHVLANAGVQSDVIVGSSSDPREARALSDYANPPRALVVTTGANGGYIETESGKTPFAAGAAPDRVVGRYGAGDTFAGALAWYLARDLSLDDACARAATHASAVLAGINPLDHQLPLE
jgi:ribokinase